MNQQPATDTPTVVLLEPIGSPNPSQGIPRPWTDLPGGCGFIRFQEGPVLENGVNGTSMEVVLKVLIERLQGYQRGPFPCRENALALTKLEEALHWLDHRTELRRAQGVEGVNVAHDSNAGSGWRTPPAR